MLGFYIFILNMSSNHIPLRNTQIPTTDPNAGLRLTEIFYSLQGEALSMGLPTIFIRLTGCPLRCHYCDTTYSFTGGQRWSLPDILTHSELYTEYLAIIWWRTFSAAKCFCFNGYVIAIWL